MFRNKLKSILLGNLNQDEVTYKSCTSSCYECYQLENYGTWTVRTAKTKPFVIPVLGMDCIPSNMLAEQPGIIIELVLVQTKPESLFIYWASKTKHLWPKSMERK